LTKPTVCLTWALSEKWTSVSSLLKSVALTSSQANLTSFIVLHSKLTSFQLQSALKCKIWDQSLWKNTHKSVLVKAWTFLSWMKTPI
jgi:hypothetical protein